MTAVALRARLGRQYNPLSMQSATKRPLLVALLLSVLLHAIGILTVPVPDGEAVVPTEAPIEVAILNAPDTAPLAPPPPQAPPPAPRQIVAPPDQINDQPPPQARFESDRDNTVLRETVHRGVPNPGPPPQPRVARVPRAAAAPAPRGNAGEDERDGTPSRPERGRPAPALEDLFASTDELVRAQREAARPAEDTPAGEGTGTGHRRLALNVAPIAPEWSLPGERGTLDHLPDIQRGDVTLLNTKANVFAPFVRRVGERVFQHLIIRQRRLELQQILTAQHPVVLRVLLDTRGKLKSVAMEDQSGSANMDDTLSDAVHTAAFDNNPPPAAANAAGEYEFVFQAQLRAFQPGPGGAPSRIESRLSVALL